METIHKNVTKVALKARRSCRDRIDMLQSRVELLTGKDRLLMTMYLKNGNTFYQMAGLNDVYCVLGRPANLSDGEKWRFRLAVALARKKRFIFADEFCSNLDRVSAAVISYNIRKFAKRQGVTFVLASGQDDILADLRPDVLVIKELAGPAEVIYKRHAR